VWQSDTRDWIKEIAERDGLVFASTGYPDIYLARAGDLVPVILAGPPGERAIWHREAFDIVTAEYTGQRVPSGVRVRVLSPASVQKPNVCGKGRSS
jgi:hypothetical protein